MGCVPIDTAEHLIISPQGERIQLLHFLQARKGVGVSRREAAAWNPNEGESRASNLADTHLH